MTGQSDFLAAEAIMHFFGPDWVGEQDPVIERVQSGMSGGTVYRCRTREGLFALKQWPPQTSRERIAAVHRVQRFVGEELTIVPQLRPIQAVWINRPREFQPLSTLPATERTCLEWAGNRFELSSWMPGKPVECLVTTEVSHAEVLRAAQLGASAIARFHRRSERLGKDEMIAPAVVRRWERLNQLQTLLPQALASETQLRGAARRVVELLTQRGSELQQQSEDRLRPWLSRPMQALWVLRDIHREHILFEAGQVSGMVDFDAVNRDTRATDLARWVGSLADSGCPLASLWTAAIEGYTQQQAISACEQELAGAIEEASWFIHLANWVIWTSKVSQEIPGGLDAAERRIEQLLRRNHVESPPRNDG